MIDVALRLFHQYLRADKTRARQAAVELFNREPTETNAVVVGAGRHCIGPFIGEGVEMVVINQVREMYRILRAAGYHLRIAVLPYPCERNVHIQIPNDPPALPVEILRELR